MVFKMKATTLSMILVLAGLVIYGFFNLRSRIQIFVLFLVVLVGGFIVFYKALED